MPLRRWTAASARSSSEGQRNYPPYCRESPAQPSAMNKVSDDMVGLLKQLISTPSFSKEEEQTATIIERLLKEAGVPASRVRNNIWAKNKHFDVRKPTILLNSHHDTVRPNKGYTLDPFAPLER